MRRVRLANMAKAPPTGRARLNLAPRLRADETLSSWLERFGGAYGMTLARFLLWLGYSKRFGAPWSRVDIDLEPPHDLGEIMLAHAGIAAESIDAHRLRFRDVLPLHLRRTFCPACWAEEGPYRRGEWARPWSLICTRHRSLLRDKPAFDPAVSELEWSWLEYYESPSLWKEPTSCWEGASWLALCAALGVDPRIEATRALLWLRELQRRGNDRRYTESPYAWQEEYVPQPLSLYFPDERLEGEWRVKRDLLIYGLLKFSSPALLESLGLGISPTRLIDTTTSPDVCLLETPVADYEVRLIASIVAEHLWNRLKAGRWRCRHPATLEVILSGEHRSIDDDFWLARRIHSWPSALQTAGRALFGQADQWAGIPSWARCRNHCVRGLPRADRRWLSVELREEWRCPWGEPYQGRIARQEAIALPEHWEDLWWKRR